MALCSAPPLQLILQNSVEEKSTGRAVCWWCSFEELHRALPLSHTSNLLVFIWNKTLDKFFFFFLKACVNFYWKSFAVSGLKKTNNNQWHFLKVLSISFLTKAAADYLFSLLCLFCHMLVLIFTRMTADHFNKASSKGGQTSLFLKRGLIKMPLNLYHAVWTQNRGTFITNCTLWFNHLYILVLNYNDYILTKFKSELVLDIYVLQVYTEAVLIKNLSCGFPVFITCSLLWLCKQLLSTTINKLTQGERGEPVMRE